jgi:hypothetical protein
MILTEANGGTRLSSTRYVHYGTITARSKRLQLTPIVRTYAIAVKTGRWAGVVTAFITMSDIKDEIDWEFPVCTLSKIEFNSFDDCIGHQGAETTQGQTNYFWQGVMRRCIS